MKVYLGPYTKFWSVYQVIDLLAYVGVSEERRDKMSDWLSDTFLQNLANWVYDKRDRKIQVRIDEYDTWNSDHTMSLIILPLLKAIKEKKHGTPATENEDVPENLRNLNLDKEEWDLPFCEKRWEWILDEMIFAHEAVALGDEWEEQFWHYSEDDKKDKFDKDAYMKYNDRINNGLRLFGKYYRALWT
jgi:hypothetical protein